jgi:hypothetical protein
METVGGRLNSYRSTSVKRYGACARRLQQPTMPESCLAQAPFYFVLGRRAVGVWRSRIGMFLFRRCLCCYLLASHTCFLKTNKQITSLSHVSLGPCRWRRTTYKPLCDESQGFDDYAQYDYPSQRGSVVNCGINDCESGSFQCMPMEILQDFWIFGGWAVPGRSH